ncbi:CPS_collapsed_G0049200.mRNA.1.CDS.1 [Saccharomyces cerevisiae]|nr:CPS_collapsed_G0049200.mRNA.1.CDS.1 [Saccharomyces cerevisiae]
MGSQIIFYFMKWVEAEGPLYGNGGRGWVDEHIDSFINAAGTLLGAPKAVPALISGEMKDTIQLNTLAMYGLEKFFSRIERVKMLQTWGGIPSMLPKGEEVIWGYEVIFRGCIE